MSSAESFASFFKRAKEIAAALAKNGETVIADGNNANAVKKVCALSPTDTAQINKAANNMMNKHNLTRDTFTPTVVR